MKCAIFDLDGTLVNTIDDLGLACDYLINKYGYKYEWSESDYKQFVGNGAKKLVMRAFDNSLSDEMLDKYYEEFKIKYDEIKLDHAHAYDGIIEALTTLKELNIKLAVVTNKPNDAARGMVETIFGENMFDVIIGVIDGVPTKPDPTTVNIALKKMDCKAKDAIYFGDSDIDIITARNAGVESVGCSWGFRSFEVLFAQNPSVIIDNPRYITKLF